LKCLLIIVEEAFLEDIWRVQAGSVSHFFKKIELDIYAFLGHLNGLNRGESTSRGRLAL